MVVLLEKCFVYKMNIKIFGILVGFLSTLNAQVSGSTCSYRAAVVEYNPKLQPNEEQTLTSSVKNYIHYIKQASEKKADIIVFPEGGLSSITMNPIPDPVDKIIPCESTNFETTQTVKDLSCASRDYSIYSVINLVEERKCEPDDNDCPSKGYYRLNTNVVFDRGGAVIARYSKYNLFDELVDRMKEPEISFFDTDFGVRFGTFICFDLLFQTPTLKLVEQYGITDFVFSTYWFSELPFLSALQAQRGWAESNNVNLLASGVNNPSRGSGGSGIYNGKYGHISQIFPEKKTTKLLVANIPKIKGCSDSDSSVFNRRLREIATWTYNSTDSNKNVETSEESVSELVFKKDQMRLFNSEVISQDKEVYESQVCSHRGFCCDFRVVKDALKPEAKNYTLRAVAFNGVRKFGIRFRGGVQVCSVLVCDGPNITDCANRIFNLNGVFKFKEIFIKGNFNPKNSLQIPSTLLSTSPLTPLPVNEYEFVKTGIGKSFEVSLELLWPKFDLQVFGIWGRDYTRDMEPELPESGSSSIVAPSVLLGAFLAFVLFAR